MITQEIRQHLELQEKDESEATTRPDIHHVTSPVYQNSYSEQRKQHINIDERNEMQRNLDPDVFQDSEFINSGRFLAENATDSSGFIKTTQIGQGLNTQMKQRKNNWLNPIGESRNNTKLSNRHSKLQQQVYSGRTEQYSDKNRYGSTNDQDRSYSVSPEQISKNFSNTQFMTNSTQISASQVNRNLMKANNAKNQSQTGQNFHQRFSMELSEKGMRPLRVNPADQQSIVLEEQSDIRQVNEKRNPLNNRNQAVMNPRRQQQRRLTAARHENIALLQRRSREQQRNGRMASAYSSSVTKPQRYTIGQQQMMSQQRINSGRRREPSLNSVQQPNFFQLSKDQRVAAFGSFDDSFAPQVLSRAQIANSGSHQEVDQLSNIIVGMSDSQTQIDVAHVNVQGNSAIAIQDGQQTRNLHEQNSRRTQQFRGKGNPNVNNHRPLTGNHNQQRHSGVYELRPPSKHQQNNSKRPLRKIESDFGNRNNFRSLTLNNSQRVNGTTMAFAQQRKNYQVGNQILPAKEEILSERQLAAATGLSGFNRHNLNQASSTSFVLSDTRVGEHKNNSPPPLAQITVSANDVAMRDRDAEAILSVNVQHTQFTNPEPAAAQMTPSYTRPTTHSATTVTTKPQSRQQNRLIIVQENGKQVALDAPKQYAGTVQRQRRVELKQGGYNGGATSAANNYDYKIRKWVLQSRNQKPTILSSSYINYAAINPVTKKPLSTSLSKTVTKLQFKKGQNNFIRTKKVGTDVQNSIVTQCESITKNRDLDTPEIIQIVPDPRDITKSITPDEFIVDKAGQVTSLLDHQNLNESMSVSRGPSQMDIIGQDDDEPRHGSVQKIHPQVKGKFETQDSSVVSSAAKLYVKDLFHKVDITDVDKTPVKNDQQIEYFDGLAASYISQQPKKTTQSSLEVDDSQEDPDKLSLTLNMGQSSILKTDNINQKRSRMQQSKQVSIRDDKNKSSNNSPNKGNILIKSSLVPKSQPQTRRSNQGKYHVNCGHSEQEQSPDRNSRSAASIGSGGARSNSRSKSMTKQRKALNKVPLSQKEIKVLSRIRSGGTGQKQQMKKSTSQNQTKVKGASFTIKNVIVTKNPDKLESSQEGSIDIRDNSQQSLSRQDMIESVKSVTTKKKSTKKRMKNNQSMPQQKKRAVKCDDCQRRTIDKVSCGGRSQMQSGAFKMTKGLKLDASTLSQRSMFNSSMRKAHSVSSQNSNYKKALNRKFNIATDLHKYSKDLDYKQYGRKLERFNRSAMGKNLTAMRKAAQLKAEIEVKWDAQREALKNVDWEHSDLNDAYKESKIFRKPIEQVLQRFAQIKHESAHKLYTDVELKYFIQLIQRKDCKGTTQEAMEENRSQIVLQYFNRSLYTLQALTKLLKIDFHYDRLFKKYETDYTVDTVLMLMTRALKMYEAIDMILTIIKLIEKLKSLEGPQGDNYDLSVMTGHSRRFTKNPAQVKNLKARIRVHIKSFLAQHTLFPVQFRYGGVDQLTLLKTRNRSQSKMSGESRIINLKVAGSTKNQRSATPGSRRSSRSKSAMSIDQQSKLSTTRRRKRVKSSHRGSMKGSSRNGDTVSLSKGQRKIQAPKRSVNLSMLSQTEKDGRKIRNFSPLRKKKGGNATPVPDTNAENANQQ